MLIPSRSFSQLASCCDTSSVITLCYLSGEEYCASTVSNCPNYSIDGSLMENALALKLLSPNNFGPFGKVDCPMQLYKLTDVSTTQAISNVGCDIIFLPNSFVNPVTNQADLVMTYIPDDVLATIYAWSQECEQNLVVATQGEATYWGYVVENENLNPNTAAPGPKPLDIFNGPFGNLNQFFQGGSFQGVFTSTPSTGTVVLANDAAGRPTVCLDLATNDILLGDIGIFCSQGAGPISNGAGINNNNDILACNIFALACEIAAVTPPKLQQFAICPLETVTLPNGAITNISGTYTDTLINIFGCDSVIITEITPREIPPTFFLHDGCIGDQYAIFINGTLYNESNPRDTIYMENETGCDSFLIVDLTFKPHSRDSFSLDLCPGENITLNNGIKISEAGIYSDTLIAFNGCDSIVTITLSYKSTTQGATSIELCRGEIFSLSNGQTISTTGQYTDILTGVNGCDSVLTINLLFKADSTYLERAICADEILVINGQSYSVSNTYVTIEKNIEGCDSLLFTTLIAGLEPDVIIPQEITVESNATFPFNQSISDLYKISWTPATGLSCANCPNPALNGNESLDEYILTITDTLGCVWDYPILLDYICNYYVPNGFSPNFDGINDEFTLLGSTCRMESFVMRIYDRWGGLIFQSEVPELGWDGKSNNQLLDPGIYTYTISFVTYGRERLFSGEVLLLR